MNRLRCVIETCGYTLDLIDNISHSCPGTYIKEFPRVETETCVNDCTRCWEMEIKGVFEPTLQV